jgi:hypothetical protein
VVPPTLNLADSPPGARTTDAGPPTYGELLAAATSALTAATRTGIGPFTDPHQAADTLSDYLRFLAVSGRHATLLLGRHRGRPAHAHGSNGGSDGR